MNKKHLDKKAREGSKKKADSNKRRKLLMSKEYSDMKDEKRRKRIYQKEWEKEQKNMKDAIETGDFNLLFR